MFEQILFTLGVATTLTASERSATPIFRGDDILTIRHAKDGALDDPLPSIVADTNRQVRICIRQVAGATIEMAQSDTGTAIPILTPAEFPPDGVKSNEYDCFNATKAVNDLLRENENAFLRYEIKRTLGRTSPTADDLNASGCEQVKTLETPPEARKLSELPAAAASIWATYTYLGDGLQATVPADFIISPEKDWPLKRVIAQLGADITRLSKLSETVEKLEDQRGGAPSATHLVAGRLSLERAKGVLEKCAAAAWKDKETLFSGEAPLGPYRRAVVFSEIGTFIGSESGLGVPLKPVDQLIFYVQRGAGSKKVFTLAQDGKHEFVLDTSQTSTPGEANWVLERIAEGTAFEGLKDLAITFQVATDKESKTIRKTSIPVLESTRWRVTTGLYYSNFPRRTLFASNEQDTGKSKSKIEENVQKGSVSAGVFATFFPWPRTTKPGRPLRWSNLVPGIVLGANLPKPTKEVMVGFAFEPVRGLQLTCGKLWGTETLLEKNAKIGDPLLATQIATYEQFGTKRHTFYAVTLDVSAVGQAIQKLIEKF